MKQVVVLENIESKIYLIRGKKVMLDRDLAVLYGVPTFRLNEAVKRNRERFPEDFMFQLTWEEERFLRSQIAMLERGRYSKYRSYAFTEQGVAMLSGVLRSKRAIRVNVAIMRAFVRLREILSTHKELAEKLGLLEQKVGKHDEEIQMIFRAIQELIRVEEKPKRRIGFHRYE